MLCSTAGPGAEDIPLLCNNGKFFWAHVGALFGVITVNSVMAGYYYRSDGAILALVATSSGGLVLLFYFIWIYNKSATASPRRNRLMGVLRRQWTGCALMPSMTVWDAERCEY